MEHVKTLDDIAPLVQEHLLPEIQASTESSMESYAADPFNDSWTFETHRWRNTWNRFKSVAKLEDCPFEVYGNSKEGKLKIGRYILRCHKIDKKSGVPTGARALKRDAPVQFSLPFLNDIEQQYPIDNVVIAVDADPKNGLRKVFLGELFRVFNSNHFFFKNEMFIFLAEDEKVPAKEINYISTQSVEINVPEEQVPEIPLGLVLSRTDKKKTSGGSEK
ncbi:hypothetical protein GKODMF_11050 [Candidatus Electrothrix gigas]